MKKTIAFVSLFGVVVFGCLNDSDKSKKSRPGDVNVVVQLEPVGALGKAQAAQDIAMGVLYLTLQAAGENTLSDTLPLSGNGQQTVVKPYSGLASGKTWTLNAVAKTSGGVTVYSGSVGFNVPAGGTHQVSLTLSAQYSMLKASFYPIRDSVTRCELLVDGGLVASQSFPKQTKVGDTVKLSHDYLSASGPGVTHAIRMDAYGVDGGGTVLLYRGDTTITVISGQNASYQVTLRWVGSSVAPPGAASITVTLGAVGTVQISGELEEANGQPLPSLETWYNIGAAGFSAGGALVLQLALSSTDVPYVAYADETNGNSIVIRRWNGTTWETLGSTGIAGAFNLLSLAMSGNVPYIAYKDQNAGDKATVKRWNGTAWELVGAPGFSAGAVGVGSLAVSKQGVPYLAFADGASDDKLTVMRFNGTTWQNQGAAGFSATVWNKLHLVIANDGTPYVALSDSNENSLSFTTGVRFWNGTTWASLSTLPGKEELSSYGNALALSDDGTPYLATVRNSNPRLFVRRFNGTTLEIMGAQDGISTTEPGSTALAVTPQGVPYVHFVDNAFDFKSTVMKWNGSAWQLVGTRGFSPGETYMVHMALSGSGVPHVAYRDVANGNKISVMAYGQAPPIVLP